MPEGFEYDPEAIRAFAAVFTEAAAQAGEIAGIVGAPKSAAADFGETWSEYGDSFAAHMATLSKDLTSLSANLGAIGTQLNQGTDLVLQSETSALDQVTTIDRNMSGGGE